MHIIKAVDHILVRILLFVKKNAQSYYTYIHKVSHGHSAKILVNFIENILTLPLMASMSISAFLAHFCQKLGSSNEISVLFPDATKLAWNNKQYIII